MNDTNAYEALTPAEREEHDRDYAEWSAWVERERLALLDLAAACGWEDRPGTQAKPPGVRPMTQTTATVEWSEVRDGFAFTNAQLKDLAKWTVKGLGRLIDWRVIVHPELTYSCLQCAYRTKAGEIKMTNCAI